MPLFDLFQADTASGEKVSIRLSGAPGFMITHGWQNSTVLHDSGNKLARIRLWLYRIVAAGYESLIKETLIYSRFRAGQIFRPAAQ